MRGLASRSLLGVLGPRPSASLVDLKVPPRFTISTKPWVTIGEDMIEEGATIEGIMVGKNGGAIAPEIEETVIVHSVMKIAHSVTLSQGGENQGHKESD